MKHTIEQLEKMFYEEGKLPDIMDSIKEELERSDYYNKTMIQGLIDNAEECKKAMQELDGIYGIIGKLYHISEGALDNWEPKLENKIRKEYAAKNEKPTDAKVKSEAGEHVAQYRRIRWYLQGYFKTIDKTLGTLQSILKYEGSPKGTVSKPQHQE